MELKGRFLKEEELRALHQATLKVLSTVGVRFQSERAIEVFKQHGARVNGNMVFIDSALLDKALACAPESFFLSGRERENDVRVGGGTPAFASASGPVYVRQAGIKRLATTEDFTNLLKLTETSRVLKVANYIVVEPQDMPENKRKLFQVASALKHSKKPLIGITMGSGLSQKCLELVRDFYGSLDEYRLIGIISPISPLVYDGHMLDHIFDYALHRQPLMFAACSQPGATSPATIAGTIVIDNAEVLAGIVLAQLIAPGLPVIYGSTSTACDLRYVAPAIGSPETGLITATISALSKYYKLPCRSGGSLTDSKLPDMQAGIESAMTMLPAIMSGVDFILQSCGILESFNTVCLEKFIIDEVTIESVMRMHRGYRIDPECLGLETIERLGPGGQFLAEEHTVQYYRSEIHTPALFSREGYEAWESKGSLGLEDRAAGECIRRLNAYVEPELTQRQKKIIEAYL